MSYFVTIQVRGDDVSHSPVFGGSAFVDGVLFGLTDASGLLTLNLADGSHEITVQHIGFTDAVTTVSGAAPLLPIQMFTGLTPPLVPSSFTVTMFPAELGSQAQATFTGPTSASQAGDINGQAIVSLLPGTYSVSVDSPWSPKPFVPISVSVDTTQASALAIHLTASDDAAASRIPKASPDLQPAASGLPVVAATSRSVDPEFIYPNSQDGKYFTFVQCRMYIGNIFIDELNTVQFVLQDNKIPVYGYRSRYYDAMAQGRSLVQGQIVINFISEGYLRLVLQEFANTQAAALDTGQASLLSDLLAADDAYRTAIKQSPTGPGATPSPLLQQISAKRSALLQQLSSDSVDDFRAARDARQTDADAPADSGYSNALYSDIPFDIVMESQGGGRTVQRRLEKCLLISNEQIVDQSGNPILDAYGFVARRLR